MLLSASQIEGVGTTTFRRQLDRALSREVVDFGLLDASSRIAFLDLGVSCARAAGLRTGQAIASYVLGACYLDVRFESSSALLTALLASTLPELRKVHAMNEWASCLIGNPGNIDQADDAVRRAALLTRAWTN